MKLKKKSWWLAQLQLKWINVCLLFRTTQKADSMYSKDALLFYVFSSKQRQVYEDLHRHAQTKNQGPLPFARKASSWRHQLWALRALFFFLQQFRWDSRGLCLKATRLQLHGPKVLFTVVQLHHNSEEGIALTRLLTQSHALVLMLHQLFQEQVFITSWQKDAHFLGPSSFFSTSKGT